jgi:uncharacterized integral membrane protein (TIGR00697 family)
MSPKQSREFLYLILAGVFIANALMGEILGGKLVVFGPFVMTMGVICWPIVFVTSDLVNEYFGKIGVRNLSLFTAVLIVYMFLIIFIGMQIPAAPFSQVNDEAFNTVFGQSLWIIVGSLVAFLLSQLIDVAVFWMVRSRTQGRYLWLRATGSTIISQLIDTFVILGIAFYLPGVLGFFPAERVISFGQFMNMSLTNYTLKLILAIVLTPLLYAVHNLIDRWLGEHESKQLIDQAAQNSLSPEKN